MTPNEKIGFKTTASPAAASTLRTGPLHSTLNTREKRYTNQDKTPQTDHGGVVSILTVPVGVAVADTHLHPVASRFIKEEK